MGNKPSAPPLEVGYVTDFTLEELALHEENCRPDVGRKKNSADDTTFLGLDLFSDTGFISETDSLQTVARDDHETVIRLLGKDGHELIAKTLLCLLYKNANIKEECPELWIDVNAEKFELQKIEWAGNQHCPFVKKTTVSWEEDSVTKTEAGWSKCRKQPPPCGGGFDMVITNKQTKESIEVSSLMPHMIYFHHFYEGNVPHRTDPEKLIRILELV